MSRGRSLGRLDGGSFDLLVVGAGIVGSRVAYEAAHHGLRVALIDAGDFGGGTSSASSKLVHGGLRYLATGDVRLVRQLQAERRVLAGSVAPHLVRPLPLVLAADRRKAAKLVAALTLYGALTASCREVPRLVGRSRAHALLPSLDPSATALLGVVPEAQTHDARLTLATVRGAAARGAVTLNYVRLDAFEQRHGRIVGAVLLDLESGAPVTVRCRAAVNAAGAWVDHVRRLEDPRARPIARLSKGIHAVLPLAQDWKAGLALFDDSRTAIAVPWHGMLLVGATDDEFEGDPGAVRPSAAEVERVLRPVARLVADGTVDPGRVVHAFAGLRVLPRGEGHDTARLSRRHLVDTGPTGLVSVAGGKLTTHRTIAVDVLRRLPVDVRPHRVRASSTPLPGAWLPGPKSLVDVDPATEAHLRGLYGSETAAVLAYAAVDASLLERIHEDGPDILAQACFARDWEHALTVVDVAARRTTLAMRGLLTEPVRATLARLLDQPEPRRDGVALTAESDPPGSTLR